MLMSNDGRGLGIEKVSGNRRLEVRVAGVVQGVGFRWFVSRHAREMNLSGWVRNLPGAGVEVVAEGPQEDLERLLLLVQSGPRSARVSDSEVSWAKPEGLKGPFDIKGW